MDANYWHNRWANNDIGWHEPTGNNLLAKHLETLSLGQLQRVFVPLCGKTRDIDWLLSQGCEVVGIELEETAVQELFQELELTPKVSTLGSLQRYSVEKNKLNLDVFVGNIFDLEADILGRVDAVFDRASMVALPEAMRVRYTAHLQRICEDAKQLLIVFEYDQSQMNGPPFSITYDDIEGYYKNFHQVSLLSSVDVSGRLKSNLEVQEKAYFLQPFA